MKLSDPKRPIMDCFMLAATATHLRQIPEREIHATDKLREAWQLVADVFRHAYLQDARFAALRELVTRTNHVRYSEPLAFLQFATASSGAPDVAVTAAVDSTGFRAEVCDRAIREVADWVDSIAAQIGDECDAGHLGLIVDEATGEVRRQGSTGRAQFEPGSPEWHMFLTAWQAGAAGVSAERMLSGYPADSAPAARKVVKQQVNAMLAGLAVRLAANRPPLLEAVER